ncbi:MerR family transcriptional regulator [Streptomyces sp. ISL-12]|uniref:DNA polymerase III subunit beta family protein n=1 Tax=Streptomyces sp. ISL-12 TaxID=2819177 RepID=UPI0020355F8D
MPIGVFARRSGLTPSALRFYDDAGLLRPAETDPATGYRYYREEQVARATALRRLREIDMPLGTVAKVLDAGPEDAVRLVDEQVAKVTADAAAVRRTAAVLKASFDASFSLSSASFTDLPGVPVTALKGPVLADAVEQVLTATAHEPGTPVLTGVRIEAAPGTVTLTATDRYRLATRTLAPADAPVTAWTGTVDGDELRSTTAGIRRAPWVRLEATPYAVRFRLADRDERLCRLLPGEYPDHRLMLASLTEVTTRVTLPKERLLRALEEHPGERITLRVTDAGVETDDAGDGTRLSAVVTGHAVRVRFALTTLYPAVSTALGPEVMLDLRGPDQPVTVRSADRGDLTTLAMPVGPDRSPAP